jgi:BirA family biotin operon repressor/biotin-[acetyl-CoA-carboxylase] ligase
MFNIIYLDSVPSSNNYVLDHLGSLVSDTVVVAFDQSKGKGTNGRVWLSPPGNLYFSIYKKLQARQIDLQYLSINVGVKIAEVLLTLGVTNIAIKWPNDLWLNQKKLGGILIETKNNPTVGFVDVVIGVGLNLVAHNQLPISQPYTSLMEEGYHFDKEILLTHLLENINRTQQLQLYAAP